MPYFVVLSTASLPIRSIRLIRHGLWRMALLAPRPYMPAGSGVRHLVIQ
jgi:hypothetical protein